MLNWCFAFYVVVGIICSIIIFTPLGFSGYLIFMLIALSLMIFGWWLHFRYNATVKLSWKQFKSMYEISARRFEIDSNGLYYVIDNHGYYLYPYENKKKIKLNFFNYLRLNIFLLIEFLSGNHKERHEKQIKDLTEIIETFQKDIEIHKERGKDYGF